MIRLPAGLQVEEIPVDVRYRRVLRGLLTRIKVLYDAIYERFGAEGLELIRDVSTRYGHDIARRARKEAPPWTIGDVGLFLVKVFNNMRSEGEVTEFTEERVAIRVPQCPYPFDHPAICAAHTAMERALVKGLNPELEYEIEVSIPCGDSHCLHVLRISGAA